MSTTELSMKMSLSPTNCRTMPEASVLSMTFGTPSGQDFHRRRPDCRPRRAAEREDAGQLTSGERVARDPGRTLRRARDGLAAVGGLPYRP